MQNEKGPIDKVKLVDLSFSQLALPKLSYVNHPSSTLHVLFYGFLENVRLIIRRTLSNKNFSDMMLRLSYQHPIFHEDVVC